MISKQKRTFCAITSLLQWSKNSLPGSAKETQVLRSHKLNHSKENLVCQEEIFSTQGMFKLVSIYRIQQHHKDNVPQNLKHDSNKIPSLLESLHVQIPQEYIFYIFTCPTSLVKFLLLKIFNI